MKKRILDLHFVNNRKASATASSNKTQTATPKETQPTKPVSSPKVVVEKKPVEKKHFQIQLNKNVETKEKEQEVPKSDKEKYLSEEAQILIKGLQIFKPLLKDKVVLDIGSSNGCFSQVLLERSIKKAYYIDNSPHKLPPEIRNNRKVVLYEHTDLEEVIPTYFYEPIEFIVCNISYVSIRKVILKIQELNFHNVECIFIFKPQYESKKEELDKLKGVIKDRKKNDKIIDEFETFCKENNVEFLGMCNCPKVDDKSNHLEYLVHLFIR